MNFLRGLILRPNNLCNKNWNCDLLSNEGLNYFFSSKEAIQVYCSSFGVTARREIAKDVGEILSSFVEYEYSEEELSFLNELFIRNNDSIKKNYLGNDSLYEKLKNMDYEGLKLLNISNDIDIKKLKTLYRNASKIHHPDVGGDIKNMQKLNEAFTLFQDAITNHIPIENTDSGSYLSNKPNSMEEWLFSCHLVLSCIYGDFYAADKSFESIEKSYFYSKKSRPSYIGHFTRNIVEFGGVLDRCCRNLGRFNMKDELTKAAKITSSYIDYVVEYWTLYNEYDFKPERNYLPDSKRLEYELGVRMVIGHPEQAQNAFRLKKIDEKKYKVIMKKYNALDQVEVNNASKLQNFYKDNSPILELTKSSYDISSIKTPKIISPLSYSQERYEDLEGNQKWEYVNIYNNTSDTSLDILKYLDLRANEILLGLIYNFDKISIQILLKEISFIKNNIDSHYNKYSMLEDFIGHLSNLKSSYRNKKLLLLKEIDDPSNDGFSASIIIDRNYLNPNKDHKKRISNTDEYLEFAKMEYKEILKYKNTGAFSNDYSKAWKRDLKALDKFHNSDLRKEMDKYWLCKKTPKPEKVIVSLIPYLGGLLELGKKFHVKNTGELQLGYHINRITIAYAKIKQWSEVIYWSELFFNLPVNYRDRSTDGELNAISKRLERAKKYHIV